MKSKVVYFEVPAEDMKRAKNFYSSAFGWEIKEMAPDYASLLCAQTDEYMHSIDPGAITGGIQKRGPRAVAPTVVVLVDNMDQAISNIEKAGGKMAIAKEKMQEKGWYAQFSDTEGNRIGLFQQL